MSWEEAAADMQEAVVDTFREKATVPYTTKDGVLIPELRIVWTEKNVAVAAGDRTVNAHNVTIGVKLGDFPVGVLPGKDDSFVRKGVTWYVQPGIAWDGQGGAEIPVMK